MSQDVLQPAPQYKHKRKIAGKALRFVYPGLSFRDEQITPELAIQAVFLARALDSSSRASYGMFQFYASIATGAFQRTPT